MEDPFYTTDPDDSEDLDLELPEEEEAETGLYEHYRFVADKGQSLLRIDKFLSVRIEGASRNRIQQAADAGCIRTNGTPVKSNYRVKPGDVVSVVMDRPRHELEILPEAIPLDIVFEDDTVLVIDKPAGLVVHPGHGNYSGTLVNALAYHFRDTPAIDTSDPRLGLVHRIDKDTSGLLVIAKTPDAKTFLSRQFAAKTTQRRYCAVVWGVPEEPEGTVSGFIGRNPKDRLQMCVTDDEINGKWAITHYARTENLGYVSRVECRLETGRTHQIRVHMKHLGHPLFNDARYGGDQILRGTTFAKYRQFVANCFAICPRQALHAQTLGFVHPVTRKELFFNSNLPPDMTQLIERWRDYMQNRTI